VSEIFARPDQVLAQSLAEDLKGRGFKVWWDTELLGSDDFYEVIYTALSNAKAAIVIWSKDSSRSKFVRDEARFALQKEKLIATKASDFNVDDIPFGFQGQHREDNSQREKIVRALEGVKSSAVTPIEDEAQAWEKVKTSKDLDQLVQFVDQYPMSPNRNLALMLVRTLAAQQTSSSRPEVTELRTSKLGAFFQGLTFRIPSFQLNAQSVWSSFGLGIGFFLFASIAFAVLAFAAIYAHATLHWKDEFAAAPLALGMALLFLLGLRQFHRWIAQRLFLAATITTFVNVFFVYASGLPLETFLNNKRSGVHANQRGGSLSGTHLFDLENVASTMSDLIDHF
jgi:hypothetical protein